MIQTCAECGFDPDDLAAGTEATELLRLIREYRSALAGNPMTGDAENREGATWTSLEYTGHMRDVCELFARRIRALLEAENAVLEVLDHDAAVADGAYRDAAPEDLLHSLAQEAAELVELLENLAPDDWSRAGTRAGDVRTIREIAQRGVHEARHHLADVAANR